MWELYAFWAFIGFYLRSSFQDDAAIWIERVPALTFGVVAIGAVGCIAGGWFSRRWGEHRVAMWALSLSTFACLLSGFAHELRPPFLLAFVALWGIMVIADSPLFSALATQHAPSGYTGTALTVQNGIGFALTVVSVQLVAIAGELVGWRWGMVLLGAGGLVSLVGLRLTRVPKDLETPST